ncbi:hypothetical protein [Candidatus Pollutiaquabacter sp.]|uniref:hypothetical protein n=1 Tax=Candidatus Pollutiaquabacter sp. TaxID=3416354 RepID=UPI003C85E42B|nr:hypothetical protein [Bacteroidota bacterium]
MKDNCKEILPTIGQKVPPQRSVEFGEDALCKSYNASQNGFPEDIVYADTIDQIKDEIDLSAKKEYDKIQKRRRYLWVISEDKINIAYEALPSEAERGCICHTNVTGKKDAIIGGELWFLKENETYTLQINFSSGRYPIKKQVELTQKSPDEIISNVVALFKCVGYTNINLIQN